MANQQDPPVGASKYLSLPGVNKAKAMQWFSLGIQEPQTYNQARLLAEAVGYSPEQSKVVAAQWQLESSGGSRIPSAYNYFGIKAFNESVRNRLKERGIEVGVGKEAQTAKDKAKFMEFSNAFEGFAAHKAFLETNKRYANALGTTTAKDFAFGLSDAGYAEPNYGNKLYKEFILPKEKNPKSGDVRPKNFGPTRSSKLKPSAPVATEGTFGEDAMTIGEIQNLPLLAPQQIQYEIPVDINPMQTKAQADFETFSQKVKPTEAVDFDAPKGWFGSGKTMFRQGGGINIDPANRGKFTAKANAAGMGVQQYASKVLGANEGVYDPSTRRQANFARNAANWNQYGGRMYADGGALYDSMGNFYADGGYSNTLGQGAQYGLQGYQLGSQFGPWGGLIGGVAGSIIGGIQGNKEDEAIADREQQIADEQARMAPVVQQSGMSVEQQDSLNPNKPTIFTPSQQYAMGGNLYQDGGPSIKAAGQREIRNPNALRLEYSPASYNYSDYINSLGYNVSLTKPNLNRPAPGDQKLVVPASLKFYQDYTDNAAAYAKDPSRFEIEGEYTQNRNLPGSPYEKYNRGVRPQEIGIEGRIGLASKRGNTNDAYGPGGEASADAILGYSQNRGFYAGAEPGIKVHYNKKDPGKARGNLHGYLGGSFPFTVQTKPAYSALRTYAPTVSLEELNSGEVIKDAQKRIIPGEGAVGRMGPKVSGQIDYTQSKGPLAGLNVGGRASALFDISTGKHVYAHPDRAISQAVAHTDSSTDVRGMRTQPYINAEVFASYPIGAAAKKVGAVADKVGKEVAKSSIFDAFRGITTPGLYLKKPEFDSRIKEGEATIGYLPGSYPNANKPFSSTEESMQYYNKPFLPTPTGEMGTTSQFETMQNPSFKYGGSFNNSGFKALPANVQAKIKSNSFAQGGPMDQLTEFNGGFKHDDPNPQNVNSGIPQGMDPNGVPNIVEKDETKDKQENYIYSDNIKVTKEIAKEFNLPSTYIGKTFSEASKLANKSNSRRENDTIEINAIKRDLGKLTAAQELTKELDLQKDIAMMQEKHPEFMNTLMAQQQSYQPMAGPGGQMMEGQMPQEMTGPQGMPIDPNQLPPEILAQMPEAQQGMQVMAYGGHIYKCGGKMYNFGGQMYNMGGSMYGMGGNMYDNGGDMTVEGTTSTLDGSNVILEDNMEDTEGMDVGGTIGNVASGLLGGMAGQQGGSAEDQLNSAVNAGVGMIPGYGQVHGLVNAAQQGLRSNLGDYNVNPITGAVSDTKTYKNEGEAALDAWLKPQHEYITEGIAEGNVGKALMGAIPILPQVMQIQDANIGPVNTGIVNPKMNRSGRAVDQLATEQMPAEEAPLYMKYGGYTAQSPNHEFNQITPMYKDNAGPQGQPLTNLYGMGGNMYSMGGRYLLNGGPGQPELAFVPPTTSQMESEMYADPYAQDFDWQGDWSPIMQEIHDKEQADKQAAYYNNLIENQSGFTPEGKTAAFNEADMMGIETPTEYAPQSFASLAFLEEEKTKKEKGKKEPKKKDPRDLRTHGTLGSTVANLLPGAYNLYQALQPLQTVTPGDLYSKYSPQKINLTQAENEAQEDYARMVNSINTSGLPAGMRIGALLAASQQAAKQKARVLSEEENLNTQLENQARQMNAQQETGAKQKAMDVNWRMRTARQEHVKELASMAKNYVDAKTANELAEKYVMMSAPDLIGEGKWQFGRQGFLEYLKSQVQAKKDAKKKDNLEG
jgi:hypothetical protein